MFRLKFSNQYTKTAFWLLVGKTVLVLLFCGGMSLTSALTRAEQEDSAAAGEEIMSVVSVHATKVEDRLVEVIYLRGSGHKAGDRARIVREAPWDDYFERTGQADSGLPVLFENDRVKLTLEEEGELVIERL